jgi:Cu-Zn family superoxide dismutase
MKTFATAVVAIATALLGACQTLSPSQHDVAATARMEPTRGHATSGSVSFEQVGHDVIVSVQLSGLTPYQEHGLHAHEKGDCTSGDGMSAGGHFNPLGKPHGPQGGEHHAGDMPALKADAQGRAEAHFVLSGVSLGSGPADLIGRGLIVHASADDYMTQPTGNSGARIACGVITRN